MKGVQEKFRECVFLALYSADMGTGNSEAFVKFLAKELRVSRRKALEAKEKAAIIRQHLDELDQLITSASETYTFDRIQSVERNVLRLGAYELFMDPKIPPKVAIAEAMRLTKKFSHPVSVSFVNALLDSDTPRKAGYVSPISDLLTS